MTNEANWLWNARCPLCGWSSKNHKHETVARIRALWHSITEHPYGHLIVSAHDPNEDRRPKLIMAGNYQQFQMCCRENDLPYRNVGIARYIWRMEDIAGIKDPLIIRYGEWWKNPLAESDYLKAIEGKK